MKGCPSRREFTMAIASGPSTDMQRHLAVCDACREEWRAVDALIVAASQLPDGIPSRDRQRRLARQLVETARAFPAPDRSPRCFFIPAAIAATVLLGSGIALFGLGGAPQPRTGREATDHKAVVVADDGARYVHACNREGRLLDETVRLIEGTISLSVATLTATQRFRVLTDDAEVEVKGTRFEVTAAQGRLLSVSVTSGKVAVTPHRGDEVLLTAGGRWRSTPSVVAESTPPATDPSAIQALDAGDASSVRKTDAYPISKPRQPLRTPAPDPSGKVDAYFKQGWALVKTGAHRDAAALFDEAVSSIGFIPDAADLYFWRAVSHFKAHSLSAGKALDEFLTHYPTAPRRDEIRTMYGWYLLEQGDPVKAEREFRAAMESPNARVKESAHNGLARIREKSTDR